MNLTTGTVEHPGADVMEKRFFDVFSSLSVSDDDRELMEETR